MLSRGVLLGLALGWGVVAAAGAQSRRAIRVQGVRPLAFGTVFPGVRRSVRRTDPVNSGQFDIRAARSAQLQLIFSLPAVMTGPGGTTMPLRFRGNDAGFSVRRSVNNQVAFDPRRPFTARLDRRGRAAVFLGGQARPRTSQRAGTYTGTVTLTVIYFP